MRYGVGNIYSIVSGLRRAGAEPVVVECIRNPGEWDGIVLPGVGAYQAASARLHDCARELGEALRMGAQLLGVCLGLQLVFTEGREAGEQGFGLALLPGKVERLVAAKLPHIGWSRVHRVPGRDCRLLEGVEDGEYFYYVHSYAYTRVEEPWVCAASRYGETLYAAVVEAPPVYGTQFHPERSGRQGRRVLENWVRLLRR